MIRWLGSIAQLVVFARFEVRGSSSGRATSFTVASGAQRAVGVGVNINWFWYVYYYIGHFIAGLHVVLLLRSLINKLNIWLQFYRMS